MKNAIMSRLSIRTKFKSYDDVEIVIMDSETNEIFVIRWNFRGKVTSIREVAKVNGKISKTKRVIDYSEADDLSEMLDKEVD